MLVLSIGIKNSFINHFLWILLCLGSSVGRAYGCKTRSLKLKIQELTKTEEDITLKLLQDEEKKFV